MFGPRQRIVHQRAAHKLAVIVIDRAFHQRLADSLGNAPKNLPLHDHRIDDGAKIIHRRPTHNLGHASLLVDLDLADVAARGKVEVRGVVEHTLLEPGLDLGSWEFVANVSLASRQRPPFDRLVGAGHAELAVFELDVAFGGLEQVRRDLLALASTLSRAFTIADMPTAPEREP